MKSTNGKGDKRRLTNEAAYGNNYGNIFGEPLPIERKPFEDEPIIHAYSSHGERIHSLIESASTFAKMFK